jgi:hypothetical protein
MLLAVPLCWDLTDSGLLRPFAAPNPSAFPVTLLKDAQRASDNVIARKAEDASASATAPLTLYQQPANPLLADMLLRRLHATARRFDPALLPSTGGGINVHLSAAAVRALASAAARPNVAIGRLFTALLADPMALIAHAAAQVDGSGPLSMLDITFASQAAGVSDGGSALVAAVRAQPSLVPLRLRARYFEVQFYIIPPRSKHVNACCAQTTAFGVLRCVYELDSR